MSGLRRLCVHVHISFVLRLSMEHLGPGLQTGLESHAKDALNLREISVYEHT